MRAQLKRSELIELVGRIRRVDFTSEREMDEAVLILVEAVTPRVLDLLKAATDQTTDESIVDQLLAVKPILL